MGLLKDPGKFDFYAKRPPQTFAQVMAKAGALAIGAFALFGLVQIFDFQSKGEKQKAWAWEDRDIRKNFMPVYSVEENDKRFEEERKKYATNFGFDNKPAEEKTNKEKPDLPGGTPDRPPPKNDPPPGDPTVERDAREARLLEEFTKEPWVKIGMGSELLNDNPTFTDFKDWRPQYRSHVMSEFQANVGRQAPPYEQLAMKLLRKLPAKDAAERKDFDARLEAGKFYFGVGEKAVNAYRGRIFEASGRLFDFYEVKVPKDAVVSAGVDKYYEGVVAFFREGRGHGEIPIVQQQVLVQMLACPDALKPYLNTSGGVSQEDLLVKEAVYVKLTGVYLRNFVYSRPVAPFSRPEKKVESQSFLPLLLSNDVEKITSDGYPLTDALLQQVKDAVSDDINFLQDEAAYYATLALANSGQEPKVVPEIGYFDLANQETGPRYRGQGVHIYGMLGDNYAPVILPPNISGLRRVYRCYVAGSVVDLNTPNRWLVDMIDLPPGLEARTLVSFNARYYRNIFETEKQSSTIRPLVIVHHVERYSTVDHSQDWLFPALLIPATVIGLIGMVWLLASDKRSREKFEQANLARIREKAEKSGALKLKPLPKQAKGSEPEKPSDPPPAQPA